MKIECVLAAALAALPMSDAWAGCYGRENGQPQTRFVLRGSEALDTKTGLIWQRCSLGMSWDDRHGCVGEKVLVDLNEAMTKAKEAGPQWRVPSGPELQSIIDRSCGSPVVDVAVFPDIRKDENGEADYWTTNPVGMANLYYFFDFMSGQADGHTRGFSMSVRLVRSDR
jgi:hypothetical protein